jgi:hypothetical protein
VSIIGKPIECNPEDYCKTFGHKPRKYGDGIFCETCDIPMADAIPIVQDGKKHVFVIRDDKAVEVPPDQVRIIQNPNAPQGCTCGTDKTCWKHERPHDLGEYFPSGKLPSNEPINFEG